MHFLYVYLFLFDAFTAKVLQVNGLETVLVVPPLRNQMDFFSRKHFEALYPLISAFSLVTYDYSNIERPGANSPVKWIRNTVEHICPETVPNYRGKRQKLLIGMNMYGMDYTLSGGGPITGRQFLDLLKLYKGSLNHAEEDEENYFEFKYVHILCALLNICFMNDFYLIAENRANTWCSIQHCTQSISVSN